MIVSGISDNDRINTERRNLGFFELRQYRVRPGKRDSWVKFMEERIIPFMVSKGMVPVGSFVGQEEEDLYVWIRRFDSEQDRERLYKAVYESEIWRDELLPVVEQMLFRDRAVVTIIEPTPKSVIR